MSVPATEQATVPTNGRRIEAGERPPSRDGRPARAARRSRWWVWAVLAVVAVGGGFAVYHRLEASRAAANEKKAQEHGVHATPVLVATARRGDLDLYLSGLGTVTPLNTVDVRTRVDGAITAVDFVEGQHVKLHQTLFEIDARPYKATLAQAQGQRKKDQAAKTSADWNVEQDSLALADHSIAQQQMETDTAARDTAAGAIAVDDANIMAAQLNVDYCNVESPLDGEIGLRMVDVGNIVHAADTASLAVVTQLQPITVIFSLREDDLNRLMRRQSDGGPITVDAYDHDLHTKVATGTLLAIDNQIDPTTGMVKIKAQFANGHNELFPSEFVNARLLVQTVRDAVLVPERAIQRDAEGNAFVYTVVDDDKPRADPKPAGGGKAEPGEKGGRDRGPPRMARMVKDVQVGPTQAAVGTGGDSTEDMTVVTAGIEPGDVVIVDGVDKLADGSPVTVRQESSTRPATNRSTTTRPTTGPTSHGGRRRKPE